ncbi:MAG: GNAT family N-acetyltransferase [Kosmotogaceae bacterium]
MNIHYEEISKKELLKLEELDRTEHIDYVYKYDNDSLVKSFLNITIPKWSNNKKDDFIQTLSEKIDKGGKAFGAFDGDKLAGISALGNRAWGNIAHLSFLHVSKDYRKQGIGRQLIKLVENEALKRGYERLYVSATASVPTVNFYMNYGFKPTKKVIKEPYEEEPNDIHMVKDIKKE